MTTTIAPHAFFFWLTAFILLFLVSISTPTWDSVSFLNAGTGPDKIGFGAFGYTGLNRTGVGYEFPAAFLDYNNGKLSSGTIHNLTSALILHPIAAGLCCLAFLLGIFELSSFYPAVPGIAAFVSGLAFILTLIVWILDMVLWGIVRDVLKDNGVSAGYGNANWLTLGAILALSIDSSSFGISVCCISVGYKTTEHRSTQAFRDVYSYTTEVYY